MDNIDWYRSAYNILREVYVEGMYVKQAMKNVVLEQSALTTKLVYGVLDKNISLDYEIMALVKTSPKLSLRIILKIGMYAIKYLNIPDYAVVNSAVDFTKKIGKSGASNMINAVLKNYASGDYDIDKVLTTEWDRLAYTYNKPIWLIKQLKHDYRKTYMDLLSTTPFEMEHIRANTRMWSHHDMLAYLDKVGVAYTDTSVGCFAKNDSVIKELFGMGKITIQALTSVLAVTVADIKPTHKVLDVCSAPGGKAVLASEYASSVVACDVYPHRLDLIESYAHRMGAQNIATRLCSGEQYISEYDQAFDVVMCDMPCSGMGVLGKNPDILLNRKAEDIATLTTIQHDILENACKYVKVGGTLIYSTCTILKCENETMVRAFLLAHPEYELVKLDLPTPNNGYIQFFEKDGYDGFFVAKMERIC